MSTSGIQSSATNAATTAQGEANNAYGIAAPIYSQMASSPQGYTAQQMANEQTASAQSTGGSTAGAVGQGALASARTNNAGGYQAGIDDSARAAQVQASQNNLNIQNQNTQLQNQHQQEGLAGLNGIYNDANSTATSNLNTADEAAANNPWMKLGQAAIAGGAAVGGAALGKPPCWIAEAIYGADDARTHIVRAYLSGPFRKSKMGDWIVRAYIRFGERIAAVVKRSGLLKAIFRPLFDHALSSAISYNTAMGK